MDSIFIAMYVVYLGRKKIPNLILTMYGKTNTGIRILMKFVHHFVIEGGAIFNNRAYMYMVPMIILLMIVMLFMMVLFPLLTMMLLLMIILLIMEMMMCW